MWKRRRIDLGMFSSEVLWQSDEGKWFSTRVLAPPLTQETQEIKSTPLHDHLVSQRICLALHQLELTGRRCHYRLGLRLHQWHRADRHQSSRQSQLQIPTHGLPLVQGMSVAVSGYLGYEEHCFAHG